MESKYRKIYVEWWKIRKSTIYGLAALVIFAAIFIGGGWYLVKSNWFASGDLDEAPKDAARIVSFEGEVRITRAATRETILVTKETYVMAGDTIQTQADGRAIVQMIDQSVYSVRPNSTVIIRDNSSLFGGRNVRVALDDGQLNVRTDQQPENTENVVEVLDTQTRVRSQTEASFNTSSGVAEIRISRGSVETNAGGGTTTLTENEFAAVNNGRIASREKLLVPPKQTSPANAGQITDSGGGVSVSFVWTDESSVPVSDYHLQVSRSPTFAADSMLVDRNRLGGRDFRLTGLQPGVYYWRLKSTSRSGQASEWNEPFRFSVVKRGASSNLDLAALAVESVGGNVFLITGRTQPGASVRVLGRETISGGDGSFKLQVSTPLSEAALEISDDRGNRAGFVISVRSSRIIRRF